MEWALVTEELCAVRVLCSHALMNNESWQTDCHGQGCKDEDGGRIWRMEGPLRSRQGTSVQRGVNCPASTSE